MSQVGGNHYTLMAIDPLTYIEANNLGFIEGNIIKYVSRYQNKNGIEDLQKAKHYLERLIEIKEAEAALFLTEDKETTT